MWGYGCVLVVAVGFVHGQLRCGPVVTTKLGRIRGLNADDTDYSMFLGVPYAKVDMEKPFGTAIPNPKFEGIFIADDDTAMCPQVENYNKTIAGNLDCLHLNIYVPNQASSTKRLPVLVWIHGGFLAYGSSSRYVYGPKFLVRHGVILITLNYRLGVYGFMCLDRPDVPGNQGLKDQELALRWIKQNIDAFGGDANKVTLMGQSAGGASVEYHLYSKTEPKLFHQVILQSGSALRTVEEMDNTVPIKISNQLGFETNDLDEALNFLNKAEARDVIEAVTKLSLSFSACAEKEYDGVVSFLNDHPYNMDVPKVKNMPVLAGFNSRELLVSYATLANSTFENWNVFRDTLAPAFKDDEAFTEIVDTARHFYVGDEKINSDLRWVLSDFNSDFRYGHLSDMSMRRFVNNGAKSVYRYLFSYSGGRNLAKNKQKIKEDGAAHADELGYLFDYYDKSTPSKDDQRIIDQMTTLWTNFVKFGNPTPETTELLPLKWTPMTRDTFHYLDIDRQLSMKKRPFHERFIFWNLIYRVYEKELRYYRRRN